ncbi:MAG: hypothetical protein CL912_13150 [Deltaproteobacteria bacterium]|nr:hypothetical protein [Deltaproteobacteria bacterium]
MLKVCCPQLISWLCVCPQALVDARDDVRTLLLLQASPRTPLFMTPLLTDCRYSSPTLEIESAIRNSLPIAPNALLQVPRCRVPLRTRTQLRKIINKCLFASSLGTPGLLRPGGTLPGRPDEH